MSRQEAASSRSSDSEIARQGVQTFIDSRGPVACHTNTVKIAPNNKTVAEMKEKCRNVRRIVLGRLDHSFRSFHVSTWSLFHNSMSLRTQTCVYFSAAYRSTCWRELRRFFQMGQRAAR